VQPASEPPRVKGHSLDELEDHEGVLGSVLVLFSRASRSLDCPWVGDHDFDSRRMMKRQGEVQAIHPGGLKCDARGATSASQAPNEGFVALASLPKRATSESLPSRRIATASSLALTSTPANTFASSFPPALRFRPVPRPCTVAYLPCECRLLVSGALRHKRRGRGPP